MKIKGKVRYIIIGLVVLLAGLYLYLMDMEAISGFVEKIIIVKISDKENPDSLRRYGDVDYNLSPDMIKEVIENPEEFFILQYNFTVKNLSSWKKIWEVKLRPTFPDEMKDIVFAYRINEPDGLVSPILINTKRKRPDAKRIIIRKQKIDGDFLKLIKQVTFEARGKIVIVQHEVDFITIGTCSAMLDTSPDILVEDNTKSEKDR